IGGALGMQSVFRKVFDEPPRPRKERAAFSLREAPFMEFLNEIAIDAVPLLCSPTVFRVGSINRANHLRFREGTGALFRRFHTLLSFVGHSSSPSEGFSPPHLYVPVRTNPKPRGPKPRA